MSCSSPGWAIPPRRGSHSSRGSPTAIGSPPSTTPGRRARRCPTGRSRRSRWPTTPPRCCALWKSRALTSSASRWGAPSRRNLLFGTPSSSAASCSRWTSSSRRRRPFPHQQSVEAFQAQVEVCLTHDTADRLSEIAAPTLVVSGELDVILPPRFGRSVAAEIPNARVEVMAGEAHQPCQETPGEFNARVDGFWREADARG